MRIYVDDSIYAGFNYDIEDIVKAWEKGLDSLYKFCEKYDIAPWPYNSIWDERYCLSYRIQLCFQDVYYYWNCGPEYDFDFGLICDPVASVMTLVSNLNNDPNNAELLKEVNKEIPKAVLTKSPSTYSPPSDITSGHLIKLALVPNNAEYTKEVEEEFSKLGKNFEVDSTTETRRKNILIKIFNAVMTSKTLDDALNKIASKTTFDSMMDFHKYDPDKINISTPISDLFKKQIKWLKYGLKSSEKCKEAGWNCFWLYADKTVKTLLSIKKCIKNKLPMSATQIACLNECIYLGHPILCGNEDENGRDCYFFVTKITKETMKDEPFISLKALLFTDIGYVLAKNVQDYKPKIEVKCRAPSCSKIIYSTHKNAVACPQEDKYHKSACLLEWTRFKRWLIKKGRKPDKDWDNPELQKEFLKNYED